MSDLSDKLWDQGFFPNVGEPWVLEDHARIRKMRERIAELEAEVERLRESEEIAWGIIANAYGSDWDLVSNEWREAASRWRDNYIAPAEKDNGS